MAQAPAYTFPVSYTTVEEIREAFTPINTVTALTSAIIAQAFAGPVQAEINAKVAKRYSLPFANPVPILSAIALRETIYRISMTRLMTSFPPSQQGKATMQVLHETDQKMLEMIAEGEIPLLDSSLQVVAADTSQMEIYSNTMNYNPTFHEGGTFDQVIDTEKLCDIVGDREGSGL